MNTSRSNREDNNQNISLTDLVELLWRAKKTIIGITLVCSCLAVVYAFSASPIYQASTKVLPPKNSDLAEYSEALGMIDIGIAGKETQRTLTSDRVYDILHTQLKSDSIKAQFLRDHYLPHFQPKDQEAAEKIVKKLDKSLKIGDPTEEDKVITLSIQDKDSKTAAQWANTYMDLAIASTHEELLKNLKSEVTAKKESTTEQIAALRKLERDIKTLKISRLQDSLAIASAMGLENPLPGTTVISLGSAPVHDNIAPEASYMRGTKSLQAEIEVLNDSKDRDAYIAGLPKLLTQQALLQAINVNPAFSVARIDMVANAPYEPIKPVKPLIIIMGIIFGLFLGTLTVLVMSVIRSK
ncbi:LPS O-antigen chain length determinant protein WzzB [Alcaligenes pakistanensis]|nr:Wzz/FepE/Etk N-terminal domain-containing protein [Alcaligenes pakistanensis]